VDTVVSTVYKAQSACLLQNCARSVMTIENVAGFGSALFEGLNVPVGAHSVF